MAQWNYLLENLGIWDGSFTSLAPTGEVIDDVPSCVALEGEHDNQAMRQTIWLFSADRQTVASERVLHYSSLSRSVLFFDTGAFSQGSMQYGPFSEFGAEMGFIEGDRRLRLVQLFNKEAQFSKITLIRERRRKSQERESPTLTVDQWVGDWQGDAITLYPDLSPPRTESIHVQTTVEGDRLIHHTLSPAPLKTTAHVMHHSSSGCTLLRAEATLDRDYPLQTLLLPGGAFSTTPCHVPRHQPFALEAGWFIAPHRRQRMIRAYDHAGAWVSLTLINEEKQP